MSAVPALRHQTVFGHLSDDEPKTLRSVLNSCVLRRYVEMWSVETRLKVCAVTELLNARDWSILFSSFMYDLLEEDFGSSDYVASKEQVSK
jgi:hypothetical protein